MANIQIIVLTYNGGAVWRRACVALQQAIVGVKRPVRVSVVDSSSHDDSAKVAMSAGFEVRSIDLNEFDHGRTRNFAVAASNSDIFIFLTQDAILYDAEALSIMISTFDDPDVAVAYGRQLPHEDANPIGAHARLFNYPDAGYVACLHNASQMGLKAVFSSNSFCAYRASTFRELGGFPECTILGEDMYFAARAIRAGYKVAYVSEAKIRHSHNYRFIEEFRRYFDIGVFHRQESWISREFGGAGGEGIRFIKSEFFYLLRYAPMWIPSAWLHDLLKFIGYRLGKSSAAFPTELCRRLSMHRRYWGK